MCLALILILVLIAPVGYVSEVKNDVPPHQNIDYCERFSLENVPGFYSMLSGETRKWYNSRLEEIPKLLKSETYRNLTEKEQAQVASNLRNCYKYMARNLMKCKTCANYLNANENTLSFEKLEKKYNGNYTAIIEKSYKSRECVNKLSKVSDFFEANIPRLYESVLFPLSIKLSRVFTNRM